MYFKTISGAAAICMAAMAAQATTLSFDQADLVTGTENGTFSSVTNTKAGVTMTTIANNGGAVRVYNAGSGEGLYIGAITSGAFNTNANTSAPASGTYGFTFSQDVTSISFVFDWLTDSSFGEETLSMFATNGGSVALATADVTNLGGTSFDVGSQTVNTSAARGKGSVTYAGPAFNGFFFDHAQDPRNIGFTVTNVSVELAPVPLPAALPMLAAALGGLGLIRRKRQRS